jgi:N utilization substance protein A
MISKEFFSALDAMAAERGMEVSEIIADLELALSAAFRKAHGEAMNARVVLNPEKTTIRVYSYKTVVADEDEKYDSEVEQETDKQAQFDEQGEIKPREACFDYDKFITLTEAREIKKTVKVGDVLEQEENVKDFGRVAAVAVKQVLNQKIKERDKAAAQQEISARQDQIITAMVKKYDGGKYLLEIPGSTLEGLLDERNNIAGQNFKSGDFIKVYVPKLREDSSISGDIFVTRTRPEFVRALFSLEVPEIERGEVNVKSIAREAGYRTKIAVASTIANIDPIGSCVGAKGARINNILNEIKPEKIDIIPWSEDPLEFIASSLSPAPVLRVEANEEEKRVRVVVPNDKLSLAIGKAGMNVRLAAKLTGWKIDVKSEEKANEEDAAFVEEFTFGE